MDLESCRLQLLESLPDADVRTDQCDVLRVYWNRLIGAVGPRGDTFLVTVADADRQDPDDITLTTHGSTIAKTEHEAVETLVSMLANLRS